MLSWREVLGAVFLMCALGCTSSRHDEVGANIGVAFQELGAAAVTRVTLTVTGDGISPAIVRDLSKVDGRWTGLIGGIPAGTNRLFTADGYDSANVRTFAGQTSGVTITRGQTVSVVIVLQQVAAPTPFVNTTPSITSLVASSNAVAPGEAVSLAATASDADLGDILSFSWQASGGSFSASAAATTSWTAPTAEGNYSLTVRVNDSRGAYHAVSIVIGVAAANGRGNALVNATFNVWPQVTSVTATPSHLAPSTTTALAVSANDPDGDALTYAWTSDCGGVFSSTSAAAPSWTAPASAPASGLCLLRVAVSDGRGGSNNGTITVSFATNPSANVAPVIDFAYQSSSVALVGEAITFGVTAHDPEGHALTFAWQRAAQSLSGAVSTASSSELAFTPSALGTVVITALVSDGVNTTTRDFTLDVASCRGAAQCGGTTPICAGGACRACASHAECGGGQLCNFANGSCGGCSTGGAGGDTCVAAYAGVCSSGACVACTNSAQCGADSCCNEGAGGVCFTRSWERIEAGGPALPPARSNLSVVYDRHRDRVIVFGGVDDAGNVFNDLWALDLATSRWTELISNTANPAPAGAPRHRINAAAVYDVANRQLVLFGGTAGNGGIADRLNDVWAVTLSNANGTAPASYQWRTLSPSGTPPAPREATMSVYDDANARMIVFGGARTQPGPICTQYADTFELRLPAGGGTPQWVVGPAAPDARFSGAVAYDAAAQRMLVFGGGIVGGAGCGPTTWQTDTIALALPPPPAALTWSAPSTFNPTPTPRGSSSDFGAYDSHAQRLLVFGGQSSSPTDGTTFALSTPGTMSWSSLPVSGATPGGRYNHGMIYDSARRRLLIIGGTTTSHVIAAPDFLYALPLGCL